MLMNMKMPTLLAFSYLSAEKISCSAELSMEKGFITLGPGPYSPLFVSQWPSRNKNLPFYLLYSTVNKNVEYEYVFEHNDRCV